MGVAVPDLGPHALPELGTQHTTGGQNQRKQGGVWWCYLQAEASESRRPSQAVPLPGPTGPYLSGSLNSSY